MAHESSPWPSQVRANRDKFPNATLFSDRAALLLLAEFAGDALFQSCHVFNLQHLHITTECSAIDLRNGERSNI